MSEATSIEVGQIWQNQTTGHQHKIVYVRGPIVSVQRLDNPDFQVTVSAVQVLDHWELVG